MICAKVNQVSFFCSTSPLKHALLKTIPKLLERQQTIKNGIQKVSAMGEFGKLLEEGKCVSMFCIIKILNKILNKLQKI